MDEERGPRLHGGFLPPEPSGPEPEPSPPQPAAPEERFLPPEHASGAGRASGPEPPGAPPAGGWTAGQPGWGALPTVPDNGDALAGIILSISAAALLLLSVGMSTIISVVCAALGIYYSRKGRARVDRGETPKHRGAAQAGFWIGVVTLVLSILMTIVWVTVAVLFATDEDFRQDLEDELDGDGGSPDGFETAIPVIVATLRATALLLR